MINIDQYSLAAIPIEMYFNEIALSLGTGFVWVHHDKFYLITNWHNVSGKDPNTGKHLSRTAAEPNRLRIWFNSRGQLGNKIAKFAPIRDAHNVGLWLVHPAHGRNVDIVALPLGDYSDVDMHPINLMASDDLHLQVGMDVFVLGFPFGIAAGGFPIWKQGSFASEPELSPAAQLHLFIDTASRPEMSGSPIIRRSWGTHMLAGGSVSMGPGAATKFVGVYSGRTATNDPLDAQLGLAWPASLLPEILIGAKTDG